MTAILGYGDGRSVWLGTDGCNTLGHTAIEDRRKMPIVKTLADGSQLGIVTAGWAVSGQLLRRWTPPEVDAEPADALADLAEDLGRWLMADELIWRRIADQEDSGSNGGHFIMGYRGTVADVDGRFNASVAMSNMAVGGCTGDAALATFLALRDHADLSPREAMAYALEYAGRVDVHVGPPYSVVEVTEADADIFTVWTVEG